MIIALSSSPLPEWPYKCDADAIAAQDRLLRAPMFDAEGEQAAQKAIEIYNSLPPATGANPLLNHNSLAPVAGLAALNQGTNDECLVIPLYNWFGEAIALQAFTPDGEKNHIIGAQPETGLFFNMARYPCKASFHGLNIRIERTGEFLHYAYPEKFTVYIVADFVTALRLYQTERSKAIDFAVIYALNEQNAAATFQTIRLMKCFDRNPELRMHFDFMLVTNKQQIKNE